jgi:exo-beta-1,3-glucanase (GH17 family)
MVRIYGTDCEQVPSVIKAAKAKGMKVFAGIYDISQVESEAQTLIDAAKNDWDMIDTVSVGNEVVNNGGSVSDVVNAINTARSMLKSAGYNGKVVTVDTFSAIIDNPELCKASDFAAANCHAFFNADTTAENAGQYVADQAAQVKKACGGMDTMITESGWPSRGDSNGAAVPSEANQKAAISSLRAAFSDNIVLFSAFDDLWKTNTAATFNAEQYWGIYGLAPSE